MSKILFCLGFFFLVVLPGQAQLNGYKYIVVPKKFDGFKKENQFRTSTQIKHLFSSNGFTALYDDQIPPDLAKNPCLGLRVLLLDKSSLLATKVTLGLRDCNGVTVYESAEGRSKSKEYESAFRQAINEAFYSFTELGYAYKLTEAVDADSIPNVPVAAAPAAVTSIEDTQIVLDSTEITSPMNAEMAAVASMSDSETEVVPSETQTATLGAAAATGLAVGIQDAPVEELWYAQPIENGYQLVDKTPKVRMILVKTAQEDTFIATVEGSPMGMVYKKDGQWWHEFFRNGKTEKTPLQLKF